MVVGFNVYSKFFFLIIFIYRVVGINGDWEFFDYWGSDGEVLFGCLEGVYLFLVIIICSLVI